MIAADGVTRIRVDAVNILRRVSHSLSDTNRMYLEQIAADIELVRNGSLALERFAEIYSISAHPARVTPANDILTD